MTFELTILGSSSAIPTSKRNPAAQVLNVLERFFLIDCGEGTQLQLRRNNIKINKIDHVFISHIHGDHVFGLFGLLSTLNLLGRRKCITVYGSNELIPIIDFFENNFADDLNFEIVVETINTRKKHLVYEDKVVLVYSVPLKHRINTYGFLFVEKPKLRNVKKEAIEKYPFSIKDIVLLKEGNDIVLEDGRKILCKEVTISPPKPRSYAYCSDTAYYESLVNNIDSVDLLYHESTFLDCDKKLAKQTGHSTAKQAAEIAKKSNTGKLLLGHFSARYRDINEFEKEAREIFENSFVVNDGDKFSIPINNIK